MMIHINLEIGSHLTPGKDLQAMISNLLFSHFEALGPNNKEDIRPFQCDNPS